MSEKVLGFKAKDAEINHKRFGTRKGYWIKANRLVPVRLKSESVSLQALEKWCGQYGYKYSEDKLGHLLSWARKQAGEKE